MSDLIRKALTRFIPWGRSSRTNETNDIEIISSPLLGEINYGCDGCFQGIKEGDFRFNCNECVESFDLCKTCYEGEPGKLHRETMGHLHEFTCETRYYANRHAIGTYVISKQRYEYIRFKELEKFVCFCASALNHVITVQHNRMVALCSVVRLEWYIFDYACALIGIPTVGITSSSDKDTLSFILNQTESSIIVCSYDLLPTLVSLINECLNVREIIVMDMKEGEAAVDLQSLYIPAGVNVWKLVDFLAKGAENLIDYTQIRTDPKEIYTICYTSGSTGKPKGCIFTREQWHKQTHVQTNFGVLGIKRVWFSFQPPSHMMEREAFHLTLLSGCKAGMYRGSMESLFDDIRMVQPTVVTATPRFFSIIHNQFLQSLNEDYQAYLQANKEGHEDTGGTPLSRIDPSKIPVEVRESTREKFKNYLGGRQKIIGVGGAAVSSELKKFISYCFEGLVEEGYGTTEVGGITSGNWRIGDVVLRLRDVPEMGYLTTDQPPRGEICVKTSYMISGYYKNPEETSEKFQDGFFCTGDIGVLESFDNVRIIDRKKNIFKLAQGEFVAPERLESIYENSSDLIEQMYIYGNIYQCNVVAVIVPHDKGLTKWFQKTKIKGQVKDISDILSHSMSDIYECYMAELRFIGQSHDLHGWEIPSAVLIEPHPFTVINQLLTCTMKKSRPQLERKYKQQLEALYLPNEGQHLSITKSFEDNVFTCVLHILKRKGIDFSSSKYCSSVDFTSTIDVTLTITQLGEDSLTAMRLSNIIEQELGVTISAVDILKQPLIETFQQIVSHLSPGETIDVTDIPYTVSCAGAASKESIDWDEEISTKFLHYSSSVEKLCSLEKKESNIVLLTGCTGFLGKFILLELLKSEKCSRVYCLIRKNEEQSAKNRILSGLAELEIELPGELKQSLICSKLVALEGDLTQPLIGLSQDDFTSLLTEVDVVIHNGANVNHILPYNDLKAVNVQCTKEMIKFCCEKKHKYLHFVSTLGVLALNPLEVANEYTVTDIERLNYLSGYGQTKCVSERLILNAISDGFIKGSISRPGLIGAHSKTGHSNKKDWFYHLICGFVDAGCYPVGPLWDNDAISVINVDTVAKSIVYLAFKWSDTIQVFHLKNKNPQTMVTMKEITDTLQEVVLDTEIQPLDEDLFIEKLNRLAKTTESPSILALHMLLTHNGCLLTPETSIDNSITSSVLRVAGINLNHSNDGYMDKYIQYLKLKKMI